MHAALQNAQRQAEGYILRSAKLAAMGGLDYAPPAGMPVRLPPLEKVGHCWRPSLTARICYDLLMSWRNDMGWGMRMLLKHVS